jgi:hypothetical protein
VAPYPQYPLAGVASVTPDARVILIIFVVMAVFVAGRKFQQMLDLWNKWQGTKAALPGMRTAAWASVRLLIKVGFIAFLVICAAAYIGYFPREEASRSEGVSDSLLAP